MNHSPGLALAVSHRQFDYARGYTGPSAAYFVDGAIVPPFLHALRALQPPNKSRALHFFRRAAAFVLFCCASSARSGTLQHRCTGHGAEPDGPECTCITVCMRATTQAAAAGCWLTDSQSDRRPCSLCARALSSPGMCAERSACPPNKPWLRIRLLNASVETPAVQR
jgi:hypothetical protein